MHLKVRRYSKSQILPYLLEFSASMISHTSSGLSDVIESSFGVVSESPQGCEHVTTLLPTKDQSATLFFKLNVTLFERLEALESARTASPFDLIAISCQ